MNAPSCAEREHRAGGLPDLDTRIMLVEQRLIAREQSLRRGIDAIGLRVRRAVRPWCRALPAIGLTLGASLLATLWWRRRPLGRGAASPGGRHAGDARHGAGIPWVHLVTLGWPLLPAAWRARISPATASTLVALGLPLMEWLRRSRHLPAPATMAAVDVPRFAGTWFVAARLPGQRPGRLGRRDAGPQVLHYRLRSDGNLDVASGAAAAGEAPVRGLARIVPGSGGAKLKLSLWPSWLRALGPAWSDHWILHVDEAYGEALVGSASRDRLWVLTREPQWPVPRMNALLAQARERGFAVERLEFAAGG
jgi:apolipoprotein D and lipocalin family protein